MEAARLSNNVHLGSRSSLHQAHGSLQRHSRI